MRTFCSGLVVAAALLAPASAQSTSNPLVGRWDFNVPTANPGAAWLGITDKGGNLEVWFQPTGGNVFKVKDFHADGAHLILTLPRSVTWDL